MRLLIATGTRYYRSASGETWTETTYDWDMWREYQAGFEEVGVFTRVLDCDPPQDGARPAGGPGIKYYRIPEWHTKRAVLRIPGIMAIARKAVAESDAVWLHSPSVEADLLYLWARRYNKPICLECRGGQALSQAYWVKRGARPARLFSAYFNRQFRRHLAHAWGCIFVAEQLRKLYEAGLPKGARSAVISDARIPDSCFKPPRARAGREGQVIRLFTVGRLEAQKDQATLIKACATLENRGMTSWELHLAGDGPLRTDLARLAVALHIEKKVLFHGFVPWGEALFCLYDGMDLFVLSSINEGMPRALLEAMARGLPCISTTVPGASELLAPEALVPTGREDLLASRILKTLQSPGALDQNAARCWERVQAFRIPNLLERKRQYLLDFHAYVCSVDHAVHPTRQRYHPGL